MPYTALWSASGTAGWQVLNQDHYGNAWPDRFQMGQTTIALYVALRKDENYSLTKQGAFGLRVPSGTGSSQRSIVGIQFDYEFIASSDYHFQIIRRSGDFITYLSTPLTVTGDGTLKTGSVYLELTSCDSVSVRLEGVNASEVTYTGETGVHYLKLTNVRVVTSTTNKIDTTTSTTISAAVAQVLTPISMDNIYVGQRLIIDSEETTSESVIVTAVTSTTFTADFANAYSGTTTVQAHVIYADEIIEDLISHVTADNPDQLSDSTDLIESPGLDLLDEIYEDAYPADIANKLAALGDNQTPPRLWEVGVWENQTLHFRPKGSGGVNGLWM